jgi:hypothetical protein
MMQTSRLKKESQNLLILVDLVKSAKCKRNVQFVSRINQGKVQTSAAIISVDCRPAGSQALENDVKNEIKVSLCVSFSDKKSRARVTCLL